MLPTLPSFNLVYEPWLPCELHSGNVTTFGLRDVFRTAPEIRELQSANPLVSTALYRFLLAVLQRALNGPRTPAEWIELFEAGTLPLERIDAYLERWGGRFDLFHPTHPFYQCADFELAAARPARGLSLEVSGGNNATLFDHSMDERVLPIAPAEAARLLIMNQAFALGGGAGVTSARFGKHPNLTHAPLAGRIVALLAGKSLFESLLLNLLILSEPDQSGDIPAWERAASIEKPAVRACRGYLDLLTWQSRCVRLLPEEQGVSHMYYAQGELFEPSARPLDPLVLQTAQDGGELAVAHRAEIALWRNSTLLLAAEKHGGPARPPRNLTQFAELSRGGLLQAVPECRCNLIGLASERAKILTCAQESLHVSPLLLTDSKASRSLRAGLEKCEAIVPALRSALRCLGRSGDAMQSEKLFWHVLEPAFKRLLRSCGGGRGEAAQQHWTAAVRAAALSAFHAAAANSPRTAAGSFSRRLAAERAFSVSLNELEAAA